MFLLTFSLDLTMWMCAAAELARWGDGDTQHSGPAAAGSSQWSSSSAGHQLAEGNCSFRTALWT